MLHTDMYCIGVGFFYAYFDAYVRQKMQIYQTIFKHSRIEIS